MSAEVIGSDGRIKDRQGVPSRGVVCRVRQGSDNALVNGYNVPVPFGVKEFDPYNWFDSAGGTYRFAPKIAGYYRCTSVVVVNGVTGTAEVDIYLRKNGTGAGATGTFAGDVTPSIPAGWAAPKASGIVYLNGTTDYVDVVVWAPSAGLMRGTSAQYPYFEAELIGVSVGVIPAPWIPLPMTANWSGTSSPDPAPQYRKQLDGHIVMRGLAVLTGAGYTAVMGTLPAGQGLRPAKPERFVVPTFAAGGAGSWGAAYISVNIDGTISHNVQFAGTTPAAAGSWVSLAGVNFPGES